MNGLRLLLCCVSLVPALSYAGNWRLDQAQSRLGFQYRAMGAPVEGEFHRYQADIQWDPAKPSRARIRLDVDTGSIDAGLPDATSEAIKGEFFDSRRYPWARFVSSAVQPQDKGRYLLQGTLTIKGISRPVSLPILLRADGPAQQLKGTFILKRLDYGIGQGQWADTSALADEVPVAFSFRLLPANSPSR
ncbi:MAG TPA: YceI family protein [Thiobacillaceae bacterium]|nr:YceI family protein [Thiobacillaceae bacterium]